MRTVLCVLVLALFGASSAYAQDTAGSDYFAQASLTNPMPFVGQQITYVFTLYDAVGLDNPLYEPSDFEGFWRIDLANISQQVQQLNGRQYTVSEVKTALYPTRSGEITILPAGVVLPATVFDSKRELKADPVTVQVQPLPAGAPDGFNGAVGQFQMSATLDRQSVTAGEPITLRVTISGTGNVEQLPLPIAAFPPNWRLYENPATYSATEQNGIIIGSKVYELLIFPDQVGEQPLPVLTLSYFDPDALAYRSVSTSPVQIEVLSSGNSQLDTTASTPAVAIIPLALKPISATLQIGAGYPDIGLWLLWLFPPVIVFALWGWRRYQSRLVHERTKSRQSQALKLAYTRLDAARNAASNDAYIQLKESILGYIADKLAGEKLKPDWQQEMNIKRLPEQVRSQLQTCIELADQGLYAPESELKLKPVIDHMAKILAEVDQVWKAP